MPKQTAIAAVLDYSFPFPRSLMMGIYLFASEIRQWSVCRIAPARGVGQALAHGGYRGILVETSNHEVRAEVMSAGLPTIDISGNYTGSHGVPRVVINDVAVGKLAAEHLFLRGARRFALCIHRSPLAWAAQRESGFVAQVQRYGLPLDILRIPRSSRPLTTSSSPLIGRIVTWLHRLNKPVGLLVQTDDWARQIADLCVLNNIDVPRDIQIIGVDNEEILCTTASVPLSTIDTGARQAGYTAAKLLHHMLTQKQTPPAITWVESARIIPRASTERIPIHDSTTTAALKLIEERATTGLTVARILDELVISRRQLERNFRDALGHSVLYEIHRVQIEYAKRLLQEGSLSSKVIARQSGFRSPQRFHATFRRFTGSTPLAFRETYRLQKGL